MTTTLSTDDDQDHAIATRAATPFGRQTNTAAVAVEGQRAIAEVQAALFIASKNPRNEIAALDQTLHSLEIASPALEDAFLALTAN